MKKLLSSVLFHVTLFLFLPSAQAGIFDTIASSSKTTDEVKPLLKSVSKAANTDAKVLEYGKSLGKGRSVKELSDDLLSLKIDNRVLFDEHEIIELIKNVPDANQTSYLSILTNLGKVTRTIGVEKVSEFAPLFQKAFDKGGGALLDCYQICSDDSVALWRATQGFADYGTDFLNIAKKFDPKQWATFVDDFKIVGEEDAAKIMKEPTHYYDIAQDGTLIRKSSFDEIAGVKKGGNTKEIGTTDKQADRLVDGGKTTDTIKNSSKIPKWVPTKMIAGAAVVYGLWQFIPYVLNKIIPEPFASYLPEWLLWPARIGVLALAFVVLFPYLFWFLIKILRATIWVLGKSLSWLGQLLFRTSSNPNAETWYGNLLAKIPYGERSASTGCNTPIRIGLCAVQRVGKSTTIAMLSKVMPTIAGCTMEPCRDKDRQVLDSILEEVSHGRATTDGKNLSFELIWPQGNTEQQLGGIRNKLEIHDFRGEDLRATALFRDRYKVAKHLKYSDVLMVSIDPTRLENPNEADRVIDQKRAIESIFNQDWLDMGRKYLRPICIVINKIDQLNENWIDAAYEQQANALANQQAWAPEKLAATKQLLANAQEGKLDSSGSIQLGRDLLNLWDPNMYARLSQRLNVNSSQTESSAIASKWYHHRYWWPRREHSGKIEVFAVSTLGKTLGAESARILEKRKQWKEELKTNLNAPEPSDQMDLGNVARYCNETMIRFPFKWMLDNLQAGWIHQLGGKFKPFQRFFVHWRFANTAEIKRDAQIGWWRFGMGIVMFIAFVLLWATQIQPTLNLWSTNYNEKQIQNFFAKYNSRAAADMEITNDLLTEWDHFAKNEWPELID